MNYREKILSLDKLAEWRADLRSAGKTLVVTNGCFDILHIGHVAYLEGARNLADVLLVGVNSDKSVRRLKGQGRPVNPEGDRAEVLAALASVGAVCVFDAVSATSFLSHAQPDIYVKGGDYSLDTLNQEERRVLEHMGARIVLLPLLPNRSTSVLINKISRL